MCKNCDKAWKEYELIEKLAREWYGNYKELTDGQKADAVKHLITKRINSPDLLAFLKKKHGLVEKKEVLKIIEKHKITLNRYFTYQPIIQELEVI